MFNNINFSGKSREQIADALVNTELEYVRSLETVDNVRNRLQQLLELERPVLNEREIARMFLNLPSITDFHKDLSKELLTLRLEGPQEFLRKLGKTFCQFIPFFKLYAAYIGNYRTASQYITKKLQQSRSFRTFVELEERCVGTNKSLKSLLGLPMGRLPQYLHILFAIHSRPGEVGTHLAKAILAIQAVSDAISVDIKSQVARKMVVTVQDKVFGKTINLISPSRHVVKKGELRVTMPSSGSRRFALSRQTEPKMYLVVLFNDFVLVGSARKRTLGNRRVKVLMRIAGLECEDPEDGTQSFVLRSNLGGVETAMIMYAQNAEQKLAWLSALDRVLDEYLHSAHEEFLDSIPDFEALILKKQHKQASQLEPKIRNPVPMDQTVIHMRPLLDSEFSDPTTIEEEPIEEEERQIGNPWQKVEGQYWINTRTMERAALDEKTVSGPGPFDVQNVPLDFVATSDPVLSPSDSLDTVPPVADEASPAPTSLQGSPKPFSRHVSLTRGASLRQVANSIPEFEPLTAPNAPPSPPPGSPPRAPEAPPPSAPQALRPSIDNSSPSRPVLRSPLRASAIPDPPPVLSLRAPASSSSGGSGDLLSALRRGATTLKKVAPAAAVPEHTTFHNAINDSIAAYIQSIRPLIQEDDDVEDPEDWT